MKHPSKEIYFSFLENSQNELKEALAFLKEAESEPKKLFTDAQIHLKQNGVVMALMIHWKEDEKYIKGYGFQEYLASVADRYLQQWVKEQDVDFSCEFRVRKPNQFPSIFALYCDGKEVVQCHLVEKWYGIRETPFIEEELIKQNKKTIEEMEKRIKKIKEEIEHLTLRRDEPLKYYTGFKNKLQYFMVNKRKLQVLCDDAILRKEKLLHMLEDEKQQMLECFPKQIEMNRRKQAFIEKMELFFVSLGYELNTEKYDLY